MQLMCKFLCITNGGVNSRRINAIFVELMLESKAMLAQQVGGGAVIFHDLKNYRLNDIEFSLEDMLRFEGETGPYVMHEHHPY